MPGLPVGGGRHGRPSRDGRADGDMADAGVARLSDLLQRRLLAPDGTPVGRISDVTISYRPDHPEVERVLVRTDGVLHAVDADLVDLLHAGAPRLRRSTSDLVRAGRFELGTTELRLGTDVVDAQIVDLSGHHLVRAGDILLARQGDAVVVVGVEVDFGAVLRRLGLRRLAGRVPTRLLPWDELHLTSRRGHEVQLESHSQHLAGSSAIDLAHLLARLSAGHASDVLQQTPVGHGAAALALSHGDVAERLLATVPDETANDLIGALPATRAAALRARLGRSSRPRRRFHRTHGWKRHAPAPTQPDQGSG